MSNGRLYYKAHDVLDNYLCGGRIRALIVHWVCHGRSDEQMLKTAVSDLLHHVHVEHAAKSPWRDEQRFSLCFRTSLEPAYAPPDIPGLQIPSAELLVECLDSTHELEHIMVMRNALDSFRRPNSRFAPAETPVWDAPTWTRF